MNKKLVLSVLSTAVVASMATSAFAAAPKAGVYLGGNIKKFYALDTLFNLNASAKTEFSNYIASLTSDFNQVVYVDASGKGASIQEILTEGYNTALNEALVPADFADQYSEVNASGQVVGTVDPEADLGGAADLQVDSVNAINAKQVEIKFTKAVDKTTVITGTDSLHSNIQVAGLAGAPSGVSKAVLSADGKTLTLTATTKFNGEYAVTVNTSVKDTDGKAVKAYSGILKVADATRPVVKSVEYVDNATAKVWFSEPLSSIGSVSLSDSTATVNTATYADGYVTVDLSAAPAAKDITLTVIGAKDFNDNLISPNPATVTVKKDTSDTVKPTVSDIVAVSDKVFKVTFSEKLKANPTVTLDGAAVTVTPEVDATGLVYTYTLASAVSNGLHTVAVTSYVDKSNNAGVAFSKVVNFVKDTVAPTVASTRVEKVNGVEHLIVTFSEDVVLGATPTVTITGTRVKDFVEYNVNKTLTAAAFGTAKNAIQLSLGAEDAGSYNVTLTASGITDASNNAAVAKSGVTFTRTVDTDPSKPALTTAGGNGIEKVDNNTYLVHFNKQLDAASALDLNNYVIEGATVTNAIFTKNDATGADVKLTILAGSVTLTGDRLVTVKNVKSAAGVSMDTVTTVENFVENVAPTVASAAITAPDTITLTFSEAMDASTIADSAADFAVYVGGVDWATVAGATYGTVTEAAYGSDNKVFTLKLGRALTADEYAKAIEVKAATGANAADANGNKVNITTVNVVK